MVGGLVACWAGGRGWICRLFFLVRRVLDKLNLACLIAAAAPFLRSCPRVSSHLSLAAVSTGQMTR